MVGERGFEPPTAGSATVTVNGSEQSNTTGTYTLGSGSATATMNGQGTDNETAIPYPPFPSVPMGSSDAVMVTANIGYQAQTDLGVGIGRAGATFEYSTNGGATWTAFYTQNLANEDFNYVKNVTFGPIGGLSNLNQLQVQAVVTAVGAGSDSDVTATASIDANAQTTAQVSGYDSGSVTVTVNGHSDMVNFQGRHGGIHRGSIGECDQQ